MFKFSQWWQQESIRGESLWCSQHLFQVVYSILFLRPALPLMCLTVVLRCVSGPFLYWKRPHPNHEGFKIDWDLHWTLTSLDHWYQGVQQRWTVGKLRVFGQLCDNHRVSGFFHFVCTRFASFVHISQWLAANPALSCTSCDMAGNLWLYSVITYLVFLTCFTCFVVCLKWFSLISSVDVHSLANVRG